VFLEYVWKFNYGNKSIYRNVIIKHCNKLGNMKLTIKIKKKSYLMYIANTYNKKVHLFYYKKSKSINFCTFTYICYLFRKKIQIDNNIWLAKISVLYSFFFLTKVYCILVLYVYLFFYNTLLPYNYRNMYIFFFFGAIGICIFILYVYLFLSTKIQ
jgi:hypothetical protein